VPGRYLLRAAGVVGVVGLAFVLVSLLWSWRATRIYTVVYRLAPARGQPAAGELDRTAEVLARRLSLLERDFHISHVSARAEGPDRLELRFSARSDADVALSWATMPCRVEFRLLAPQDPAAGGPPPAGYELKVFREQQYILGRGGDLQTVRHSYAVERRPALVLDGVQEASIATPGLHKMAVLTFRFGQKDAEAFAAMTALNVGRRMAMLIDGEMFFPPKEVQSPITGGAVQISGYFQLPPLRKLVKMLNTGPLPGTLEEVSRTVQ
jgi:preprotein translocase subunit SecD